MPNGPKFLEIILNIGGVQNPDNTVGQTTQYPNNFTFLYGKTASNPQTNSSSLVLPNGDIDLTQLPTGPGFSQEVDLYFVLTGQIQGTDGLMYSPRWAKAGEGGPADQPYCWLVASETDPTVQPWPPGMAASLSKSTPGAVKIDDNRRGTPYFYNLGVCFDNLPGWRNAAYFITFDPKIVNPNK